jgi:hypothetical protein
VLEDTLNSTSTPMFDAAKHINKVLRVT